MVNESVALEKGYALRVSERCVVPMFSAFYRESAPTTGADEAVPKEVVDPCFGSDHHALFCEIELAPVASSAGSSRRGVVEKSVQRGKGWTKANKVRPKINPSGESSEF